MFNHPSESLNRICSFLDVDNEFYQDQSWISETIHGASAVRSILLHKMIGTTATWMRRHKGLRQLLDLMKKIGLAPWFKQANRKERSYPTMSDDIRRELDGYYASTVRHVEEILGRKVKSWRERSMVNLSRSG
ncbi:MAG: hypothetical protein ABEI13_00855, partial [Candidatus Paceibacteria bacterium]